MGYNTRKAMKRKLQRCAILQRNLVIMLTELGATYDEIAPDITQSIVAMIGTQEACLEVLTLISDKLFEL